MSISCNGQFLYIVHKHLNEKIVKLMGYDAKRYSYEIFDTKTQETLWEKSYTSVGHVVIFVYTCSKMSSVQFNKSFNKSCTISNKQKI